MKNFRTVVFRLENWHYLNRYHFAFHQVSDPPLLAVDLDFSQGWIQNMDTGSSVKSIFRMTVWVQLWVFFVCFLSCKFSTLDRFLSTKIEFDPKPKINTYLHLLLFQKMSRSLHSPTSLLSSPSKLGDRFIPTRAGANWNINFHRINVRKQILVMFRLLLFTALAKMSV